MNLLGGMEVILSDDTAVVLSTSVESKYLIVKLPSSPADSFIEICTVEEFRDTAFIIEKPIASEDWYYRFKLMAGGFLSVISDFLYCA